MFSIGFFESTVGRTFLGVVQGASVTPVVDLVGNAFGESPTLQDLLVAWPEALEHLKAAVSAAREWPSRDRAAQIGLEELRILAPLQGPRQVFCTGANYRKHVVEMVIAVGAGPETEHMNAEERRRFGEGYVARQIAESQPYVFMKPWTTIAGPNDVLKLPEFSSQVDWELELGVVIGRQAERESRDSAMSCVAGYMVVNDLTARDKVRRTDPGSIGADWVAAKGCPGFLPIGPYFVPAEFVPHPDDLGMRLSVNGQAMQDDRTSDMTFDIARQIEHITRFARMAPGDILCTGSPAGNGIARGIFLKPGDVMEAEIDGLGSQRTIVSAQGDSN